VGMMLHGLRNLGRSQRRLVITALLLGFPIFILLMLQAIEAAVQAYLAEMKRHVDNAVQVRARGSMGHVNMVGSDRLLPPDALEKVRSIPHVVKVEPYLLAMSPTEGHNFAMHVGVNPGDAKRLESHGEAGNPRLIAGRDFTPEDQGQDVAIIGRGYAQWAGITPENLAQARLTIDPTRSNPVIYALPLPKRELRLIGIYASGYVFGDMQLFMPLDTFKTIYRADGISWLYVTVASADHLDAVAAQIETMLGDVADVFAPTNAAVFERTTARAIDAVAQVGTALAFGLMLIVVFFTMLLTVRERTREIGTLKAIGASNAGIIAQFLSEAIGLSVLGGLLGVIVFRAVGGAAGEWLFGVSVAPLLPAEYRHTLFASLGVGAGVSFASLGFLGLVCVAAAMLGSLYGVWRLLKLSPLEAIRHA
jgi:ABC-type lipoprotein release transport system permease subunit